MKREIVIAVLIIAGAFGVSYSVGRVYADCAATCKSISCGWPGIDDEDYPCWKYDPPRCFGDVTYRDPPGGTCTAVTGTWSRWKCPDCELRCPPAFPPTPVEGAGCTLMNFPMPGCTVGECCIPNNINVSPTFECRFGSGG